MSEKLETTKAGRAALTAKYKTSPLSKLKESPQSNCLALCRDMDTLVGLAQDRANAAHYFGATLGRDASGHAGDFQDCQNGKCIEARTILGE